MYCIESAVLRHMCPHFPSLWTLFADNKGISANNVNKFNIYNHLNKLLPFVQWYLGVFFAGGGMTEFVQVKAEIPRNLKRRAFAALALREERFNRWLTTQLEALVREDADHDRDTSDERLVGSTTRG